MNSSGRLGSVAIATAVGANAPNATVCVYWIHVGQIGRSASTNLVVCTQLCKHIHFVCSNGSSSVRSDLLLTDQKGLLCHIFQADVHISEWIDVDLEDVYEMKFSCWILTYSNF